MAAAQCRWAASCLLDGEPTGLDGYAAEMCHGSALFGGSGTVDPELARACLTGLAERACWMDVPLACHAAVRGTAVAGEPCSFEHGCSFGTVCAGCPRTCVPVGWEGSTCTEATDCQPRLDCLDGICRLPGLGEPCGANAGCSGDLFCDRVSPRRCRRAPELGESCVTFGAPDWCADRTLVCVSRFGDPVAGTCVAARALGEPCSSEEPCAPGHTCFAGACVRRALAGEPCAATEVCVAGQACVDGICVSLPAVGERCDDLPCFHGVCSGGVCTLLPPGAVCDAFDVCSSYCDRDSGRCGDPKPSGAACESTFECERGSTCWGEPGGERVCRRC